MENRINKVGNESGNAINLYQNLINLKRTTTVVLFSEKGGSTHSRNTHFNSSFTECLE